MAIFAEIEYTAQFHSTVGTVADQPVSGYEDGGSIWARGTTGTPGYGRLDLGEEKSDLYVRAHCLVPSSTLGSFTAPGNQPEPHIISSRRAADATVCFTLRPAWTAGFRSMDGLVLTVHHNTGSVDYTLEHPTPNNKGVFWVEFRVTTGSTYGTVTAWIGGELVLPETRILPNHLRTARHFHFGAVSNLATTGWDQVNLDKIILADEYSGPPDFVKTSKKTWSQHGRTYTIWDVRGGPTGGWQDILPGVSDYIIETLTLQPARPGSVELRDGNGNALWHSGTEIAVRNWDTERGHRKVWEGKDHAVQHARQIRCSGEGIGDIWRMWMRVRT